MKNIILLILFLIITFVLNIIFYYNSSDYRVFLKGLKKEEVVQNNEIVTTGSQQQSIKEKIEKLKSSTKNTQNKDQNIVEKRELDTKPQIKLKQEIKLGKNYTNILTYFSKYKLEFLKINTNLFDITNEYPDTYFEYYSRNLTVYLFPTKSYSDVLDIFSVLETELPFSINETNTFGNKSFYINLNQDIDDSIVRVVIEKKGIVFGLKIKKNEYTNVKKILDSME